jgi:predicted phage tail component-like protein
MRWIDGVKSIERNVGQNMTNSLIKIGREPGEHFQYTSPSHGTITVTALILNKPDRRALASALTVDKPQQLVFGDEPDKYYMAIPDAQTTLTEAYQNNVLTIVFIVPDGIAHSVATKTADNIATDGTLGDELVVKNNGTYPVYPVIEATMHSDNGVLALINEENGGVLQFGDAEQIDGEEKQKSEQVIHDTFSGGKPDSSLTANAGTIFFNDAGRSKIEGGFTSSETKDAVVPTFIGTSSDRWNGPTLHGNIPATAEGKNTGNFLFENRVNFTAAVGHNGRVEFILNSPDGVAMVFVLRDTITTKKQLVIEAWCMGEQLAQKVVDLGIFNSNFFDIQMGRIGSQLLFQIAKISSLNGDVPSYASKVTMTPTFSKFADVPITSITAWFSRFGNHEESEMAWTDSKFIWTDIAYWNDLANTFSSGDVVTIDTENRGVALNGVNVSGLQSIDNDWGKFGLLPGTNHISVYYSSFSKTPTVTATIREAFL